MVKQTYVDPAPGGLPTGRRAEVLDLLRRAREPLGVQEVADRAGLHPNTARFHLEGLVADALATRSAEARDEPGRPRVVYEARPDSHPGVRSYQLLAEMLTGLVAGMVADPSGTARDVGFEWGRHLTETVPPSQRIGAEQAAERLRGLLDAIGFAPELAGRAEAPEVRLRHCPFREVAERHQDVVCALHLGLLRGSLAAMRAPLHAADLLPFIEPSLCVAHLTTDEGPGE